MKQLIFLLLLTSAFLISCKKDDPTRCTYTTPTAVASTAEKTYLQNYVNSNSIPATRDSSGVFYTINQGSGATPTVCSNISVTYVGSVLGGNIFDATPAGSQLKIVLGQLILGWQTVLPLLRTGGSITLYIPPSLGYGATTKYDLNGNIVIPPNSYLKFDIQLLDVQ